MDTAGSTPADLPFVDEQHLVVDASPAAVWASLAAALPRSNSLFTAYAHLIATRPSGTAGTFPAVGATVSGFAVVVAEPSRRLVLTGAHRFSTYRLTFVLTDREGGGTVLTARTDAAFPGVGGRAYRMLVIGTRAHRVVVRRMLWSVALSARSAAGQHSG